MATHNAFTPSGQVILTACRLAQDEGMSQLDGPFYAACLRDAVQELCFDTAWDIQTKDYGMPKSGIINIPEVAGFRHIYVYDGDHCGIGETQDAFIKPNYTHKGGDGFFALQKGVNNNAVVDDTFVLGEPDGLFYCGVEMGCVYFSPQCRRFSKVRLVYQGLGQSDPCEVPAVPTWAREAVVNYIAKRACQMRISENANLFTMLARGFDNELKSPMGAWRTAQVRYRRMDYKERQDANILNTYFGNIR